MSWKGSISCCLHLVVLWRKAAKNHQLLKRKECVKPGVSSLFHTNSTPVYFTQQLSCLWLTACNWWWWYTTKCLSSNQTECKFKKILKFPYLQCIFPSHCLDSTTNGIPVELFEKYTKGDRGTVTQKDPGTEKNSNTGGNLITASLAPAPIALSG